MTEPRNTHANTTHYKGKPCRVCEMDDIIQNADSDYTPTTDEFHVPLTYDHVRDCFVAGDWPGGYEHEWISHRDASAAEFDAWIRQLKADAWDECGRDLHGEEYEMSEMYLRNPYRKTQA